MLRDLRAILLQLVVCLLESTVRGQGNDDLLLNILRGNRFITRYVPREK